MLLNVRTEIINQFRDRIQNSDRLRLSKDDLGGLIDGFIEALRSTKTEQKIRTLCASEIQLLEEGYPQASVAKYLTQYRKAITTAIANDSLKLTEENSHRFVHQQRVTGVREERSEHWALTYLKYSPEIYESIDKRSQLTNRGKQLNLRLVPLNRYLEVLKGFLNKKGPFEARWLVTAIAGLTGRRFAEVMAKGTFTLASHPYLLHFQGQLKSRAGREEGYDIVTLFPATEVLEAIARLRRLPEVKEIYELEGKELSVALNGFNQKLNNMCAATLMQVVPPLEGKKSVSVHNLRSLYGAIAVHFFCPELQHEYAFVQHFLGHVMDSPATGHYFRFALCDDQGQLIRDKGIRLNEIESLPLQKNISVIKERREEAKEEEPQQMTLRIVRDNRQAITSMNKDEMQGLREEWRDEVERRMATLRDEFEVQLQKVRQEHNVGWFVRRVEGLERENLKLRLEHDRAIAEAIQGQDHSEEISKLKAENKTLTQELKLAQQKLDAFRRLLNGDTTDLNVASVAESEEPDQVKWPSLDSAEEEDPRDRAIAPLQTQNLRPEPTESSVQREGGLTRGPRAGKAFRRAESIFLAIKDWNHLYPTESFSINPGVMETIFRVHRQAVKEFFDAYQNELWEYHQELGVDSPRWHNRGKDTQKLKAFVQERLMGSSART
jgi:Telomere resolvase